MYHNLKFAPVLSVLALGVIAPASSCASVIYTYSGGTVNISFTFTANPDNLPSGTDILANIQSGSFSMTYPVPATDNASFPIGGGPGSSYQSFTLSDIMIGTDSGGNITSWDITGTQFASYPAFPGENPTDFYCNYGVTFTGSGGTAPLTTDHDAGFCPSSDNTTATGSWSSSVQSTGAPEPSAFLLLASGLAALLVGRRQWLRIRG